MAAKDLVGDFIMRLYDNVKIPDCRESKKGFVLREFKAFLRESNPNLGRLSDDAALDRYLQNSNFICKKNSNEKVYRFDFNALFKYRNKIIAALDDAQIQQANNLMNLDLKNIDIDKPKVLEGYPAEKVIFRFRIRQNVKPSFDLSPKGCYCCQLNFDEDDEYIKHVDSHMQESRFPYPNQTVDESLPNQFSITYKLCEKYQVCLSIKSLNKINEIMGIVVFCSGSIHNLNVESVMSDVMSENYTVYINWKIFAIACEHPIVIVFKTSTDQSNMRFIEEHHFLRFEGFPASIHLLSKHDFVKDELKINNDLPEYQPGSTAKILHTNDFNASIHLVSPNVRDYLKKIVPLDPENVCEVFTLLVEMEDYALSEAYENLGRKSVMIRMDSLGKYFIKMPEFSESQSLEEILNVGDKIVITRKNYVQQRSSIHRKVDEIKVFCSILKVSNDRVYFDIKTRRISENMLCDVTFEPQRLILKYQYRALNFLKNATLLKRRLFPVDEIRCDSVNIRYDKFKILEKRIFKNFVLTVERFKGFTRIGSPNIDECFVSMNILSYQRNEMMPKFY